MYFPGTGKDGGEVNRTILGEIGEFVAARRSRMPKAKRIRWVVLAVVGALGGTVVAVTYSFGPLSNRPSVSPTSPPARPVSPKSGVGPGSVGGFSDRPHIIPGQPTPIDPALRADQAKPRFKGPMGDFLVTPHEVAELPPCPQPRRPVTAEDVKASELYSPVLGGAYIGHDDDRAYGCADGTIQIMGSIPAARRYFVGPAKVAWEAPLDRLVLLTVAGHPAIALLPIPGWPMRDMLELVVVQRFPSSDKPGIIVLVGHTDQTLDEAVAKAERIIGVRP